MFYQDARRFNVTIRPPDINRSQADFDVENGEVLYALGAIRNVGFEAMLSVVQGARAGRPLHRSVRLPRTHRSARRQQAAPWKTWPRPGPSIPSIPNRTQIVAAADMLIAYAQSVAAEREGGQVSLFGSSEAVPAAPAQGAAGLGPCRPRRRAFGHRLLSFRSPAAGHARRLQAPTHHPLCRSPGPGGRRSRSLPHGRRRPPPPGTRRCWFW